LFPLGFFLFGAFDRWLSYRRSRDYLDLVKSYAAQGKEPPPELIRAVRGGRSYDEWGDWGGYYGARAARRAARRAVRRGVMMEDPADDAPPPRARTVEGGQGDPKLDLEWEQMRYAARARRRHYWEWRTAITTGAVAVGFWLGSEYAGFAEDAFRIIAIIMTCIAGAHLALALFSLMFRDR
jgi:hypothetical protein